MLFERRATRLFTRGRRMRNLSMSQIAAVFALMAGAAIAWVDSRATWDDTGMTVGALFIAAGLAALLGLRWWISALLVSCPLAVAEVRGAGWGLVPVVLAFAVAGAAGGGLLRRLGSQRRVE